MPLEEDEHDQARQDDQYRSRRKQRYVPDVLSLEGSEPGGLVRTLTWDQGREMARWADVEAALGIEVFFCEARSPWQRPTNEHTNGLLRRWLPKGTSLDIGQLRLAVIEDKLNHMPRAPAIVLRDGSSTRTSAIKN